MDLNSYQLQAVSHGKGPARVLAGPGSGKTAVIIHRVRQLIESCKVPPASILTVTFSRAAAEEMRSRFARLSSGNAGFSTVHSLFFHILDQYSGNDTSRLIRESEVFQIFRRDLEQDFSLLQGPMQQIRDILQDISRAKNMSEHPENPLDYQPVNLTPELFRKYFTRYQEELQRRNAMDYDDILGISSCY